MQSNKDISQFLLYHHLSKFFFAMNQNSSVNLVTVLRSVYDGAMDIVFPVGRACPVSHLTGQ
jgi:hypothetical protein